METKQLIPGLIYEDRVISSEYADQLINYISKQEWIEGPGHRKVQQYGKYYDYNKRDITDQKVPAIPEIFIKLADYLDIKKPTQIIINKYEKRQGITHHIDHLSFDDTVHSLSLLSGTTMEFKKRQEKRYQYLKPRSLLTLTGDARYKWTHCIDSKKTTDTLNGMKISRDLRYSITFRRMKNDSDELD